MLPVYYFLFETLSKGSTIGKFITGTKVVKDDGEEPTIRDYAIRSLSRIVPFESLSFLFSYGWHDMWSHTCVVKKKAFENDLQILQNEIDIEEK